MDWSRFVPATFEYDEKRDKLAEQGVILEEAIQCFSYDYVVRRNKRFKDR